MAEWWAARTGISHHPKTYRLAEALNVDDAAGLGYMVRLYDFAAGYRERGDLTGLTPREIARGCGWSGDPQVFVAALRSAGLLDGDHVHDWQANQGPSLDARDKARDRMRNHRSRNETRTVPVTKPEQYVERSEDLPTYLSTYLPTNQPISSTADSLSEPSALASEFAFGCKENKTWSPTQAQVTHWESQFPEIDVRAELTKAAEWSAANRPKAVRWMPTFVESWLERATPTKGPNAMTPERERELKIRQLRKELSAYRSMNVPVAVMQTERELRSLGVEP